VIFPATAFTGLFCALEQGFSICGNADGIRMRRPVVLLVEGERRSAPVLELHPGAVELT
jgi:hypothetical protein